jgi:hypothetical protein
VKGEGGIDAIEGAALDHEHLATAAFLGGRTEDEDGAFAGCEGLLEGEGGGDAGDGDEVVPAGVADARERVVLAEDGNGRGAGAAGGPERRGEFVGAAGDRESGVFQVIGDDGVGVALFEAQLGLPVDGEGEVAEVG